MDQKIKYEFTIEQVNTILKSLSEQPFKAVADIITLMQKEAQVQIDAANKGVVPPEI